MGAALAAIGLYSSPAWAAFPGRNGDLVVATAGGLQLVDPSSGTANEICPSALLCGRPTQPRVSPNGQAITYLDAAGHRAIVITPDGTCLWCLLGRPLTSLTGSHPSFEPGGHAITLVAGSVRSVSLTGRRTRRVVKGSASDAVWSSRRALALVRDGWIWIRSLHHRNLRRLARGHSPSFSPDGTKLAVVRKDWVWILPLDRGRARRLVRGTSPAWSPDGRELAYVGRLGAIEIVPIRGGKSRGVGSVTGRSLDWQPLRNARSCVPPRSAIVIASSPGAVVYHVVNQYGSDTTYGCLRALGVPHPLLTLPYEAEGGTRMASQPTFDGRFAAFEAQNWSKYGCGTVGLELADLGDGTVTRPVPSLGNGLATGCPTPGPSVAAFGLDSSGFTAWRTTQSPMREQINSISCPSATLCVAGDGVSNVVTSADPTGGPVAWNLADVATGTSIEGVSCPSTTLCVAVGSGGRVLTSTDPTGGASAWTSATIPGNDFLEAVSCPSASLCVAVAPGGRVFTSTNPTAGAGTWTSATIPGNDFLTGISCPSTSLCVAVDSDESILSSTNPTGGPGAWTASTIPGVGALYGVSCPSASLCVAVDALGHVLSSTNPAGGAGAWTSTTLSPSGLISAVSCPSTSLCVGAESDGNIAASTDPTGGANAWTTYRIATHNLTAVSCPSASMCAATDNNGDIFTTTDPTGGAGAWANAPVDVADCAPQSRPCVAEQLYVDDDNGIRLIDSAPAGAGNVIGNLSLSGDSLILSWTHNSQQRQLSLH